MSRPAFVPTLPACSARRAIAATPHAARQTIATTTPLHAAIAHSSYPTPLPISQLQAPTQLRPPRAAPLPPSSRILLWMDGAQRVHDNVALTAAARATRHAPDAALVPVLLAPHSPPPALAAELRAALQTLGSDLLCKTAQPTRELPALCARLRLHAVYFVRAAYGQLARHQRQAESALRRAGVHVHSFAPDVLPVTRASEAKRLRVRDLAAAVDSVKATERSQAPPSSLPAVPTAVARETQLCVTPRVGGGSSAAFKLLARMTRREELSHARRLPDQLAFRLKLHLDHGSISMRTVAARVAAVMGSLTGSTFHELVWRTFLAASHSNTRAPQRALTSA
ncbi:unnamed protein product [Agarophyton chilense]